MMEVSSNGGQVAGLRRESPALGVYGSVEEGAVYYNRTSGAALWALDNAPDGDLSAVYYNRTSGAALSVTSVRQEGWGHDDIGRIRTQHASARQRAAQP